jgi:transposase
MSPPKRVVSEEFGGVPGRARLVAMTNPVRLSTARRMSSAVRPRLPRHHNGVLVSRSVPNARGLNPVAAAGTRHDPRRISSGDLGRGRTHWPRRGSHCHRRSLEAQRRHVREPSHRRQRMVRRLYSRLNDTVRGAIVIIMQRLHEDDLVGHVLKQEGWEIVSFPAIA